MSSVDFLRIVLFLIGLLILGGIVFQHYWVQQRQGRRNAPRGNRREPRVGDLDELDPPPLAADAADLAAEDSEQEQLWGDFEELDDPPPLHTRVVPKGGDATLKQAVVNQQARNKAPAANNLAGMAAKADKIVTLYVKARSGRRISGVELLDAAIKTGLQFGDRKIFHRLPEGALKPVFSMANLVKPGFFEPGEWNMFATPGVTLFMTLPGPQPALDTWDAMHAAGVRLAELLHAELLDDARCLMTRQRVGQLREEMREYDRRQEIQRGLDPHT